MRHLGLAAGILFVPFSLFAQAPVSPSAPPRDRTALEASTGTAQLRGRVVAADTGEPLRRAQVRMTLPGTRTMRLANTDAEGRYGFANLPAGRYSLNVTKGGYVGLQFGQRRPFESGRPLELADGQVAEQIDFALPRGSVIVGRIVDEDGDPVVGASVRAMRYMYTSEGRRRLASTTSQNWLTGLTNDLGEFRLFGLMPGTYVVAASALNADIIPMNRYSGTTSIDRPTGYVESYYPGTANVAEAAPIAVSLSEEAQASFSLKRARMSEISGTIRRSDGERSSGSRVILRPDESVGYVMESWGNTIVAADGGFSFAHVPPGRFILDIVPGRFADSTTPQEFATTKLIVNGDNASGIVITTRPGITASGRVIVPATATGRKLRIGAVPSEAGALGFRGAAGSALVDEKGRFQMQHVTGSVLFRLFDSQPDLVLRSVTLGGVDITDTPYDSTNGDVSDLAITFVEQAQITGTARNSRGEQVKDFRVALFPATANSASLSARFVRTAAPDSNGRFHIGALPPGEYVAVAVEAFDDGQEWDPAFRQTVVGRAKRVAVKDGQTLTIELPYVE